MLALCGIKRRIHGQANDQRVSERALMVTLVNCVSVCMCGRHQIGLNMIELRWDDTNRDSLYNSCLALSLVTKCSGAV